MGGLVGFLDDGHKKYFLSGIRDFFVAKCLFSHNINERCFAL